MFICIYLFLYSKYEINKENNDKDKSTNAYFANHSDII